MLVVIKPTKEQIEVLEQRIIPLPNMLVKEFVWTGNIFGGVTKIFCFKYFLNYDKNEKLITYIGERENKYYSFVGILINLNNILNQNSNISVNNIINVSVPNIVLYEAQDFDYLKDPFDTLSNYWGKKANSSIPGLISALEASKDKEERRWIKTILLEKKGKKFLKYLEKYGEINQGKQTLKLLRKIVKIKEKKVLHHITGCY